MKILKKNTVLSALVAYVIILLIGKQSAVTPLILEKQLFLNLWGILFVMCGINLYIMRKNNPVKPNEDAAGAFCAFCLLSIVWCLLYFVLDAWSFAAGLSIVLVGVINSAVMLSAQNGVWWCLAMIPTEIWSVFVLTESFLQYKTMG